MIRHMAETKRGARKLRRFTVLLEVESESLTVKDFRLAGSTLLLEDPDGVPYRVSADESALPVQGRIRSLRAQRGDR